jgi:hypothetical protein
MTPRTGRVFRFFDLAASTREDYRRHTNRGSRRMKFDVERTITFVWPHGFDSKWPLCAITG